MPFHRWYKWLEGRFTDLREAFLKEQDKAEKKEEEKDKSDLSTTGKKKKRGVFDKIARFLGKDSSKPKKIKEEK